MVRKTTPVMVLRIRDRFLAQGVIPYGSRLLVGVSGGADSMTLLHVLFYLRHEFALDLVVAHYDHALRPGSARDRSWVERSARGLGLRCVSERNKMRCPRGASVEDFARSRRFDFFVRMVKKTGADAVVLAHTQDDLAETVLMRILRGTGLAGLRSILPKREIQGVMFLRPMLAVKRAEVELFLKESRIEYVDDPTNAQDDFLRNRVRHQLIPYMARAFTPAIKEKLAELAVNAAYDHEVLETELKKVLGKVLRLTPGKARIMRGPWKACPQAIRRMALREAVARIPSRDVQISHEHVAALERAVMGHVPLSMPLPSGLKVEITDKSVTLS